MSLIFLALVSFATGYLLCSAYTNTAIDGYKAHLSYLKDDNSYLLAETKLLREEIKLLEQRMKNVP